MVVRACGHWKTLEMGYAAITFALLGFAVGMIFRLQVLLIVLAMLLVASIVYCVSSGFNFVDALLTVMAVQTIVQGSYFLGLIARTVFAANGMRQIL